MTAILVIGGSGQLARALRERLAVQDVTASFVGRDRIDLSRPEAVFETIVQLSPELVINAAAYTAVDRAEDEAELAHLINAEAPGEIARACAIIGAAFVHVSSDYVFDGLKAGAYVESDPVRAINIYGASKIAGEERVLAFCPGASILRASWVYSATGANFVTTMLRLAQDASVVRVVADQFGRPTSAFDLAGDCLAVGRLLCDGDDRVAGILNATGAGAPASWADFAECIFAHAQARGRRAARVERIATDAYPTRAKRPTNSVLALDRIEAVLGPRPDWRDSVARVCGEIFRLS